MNMPIRSHKNSMAFPGFLFLLICFLFVSLSQADVVTDGTVGPEKALSGPHYMISEQLGTIKGKNLFHSFKKFSIFCPEESAMFTGPNTIQNVISRVTGGDKSTINGPLRSKVGQADFFFINPSGVMFGPHAKIDVPAAFHVSTADELRFCGGEVFSASDPGKSVLSAETPQSFGFLSSQSAEITLNGCQLEFSPENEVSLSAGDITMSGTSDSKAGVKCKNGTIQLSAIGDQTGDIPIMGESSGIMKGKMSLESAEVDVSGNGGGNILIQLGDLQIKESVVLNNNTGNIDAIGGINIFSDGYIFIEQGVFVKSNTNRGGNAGDVIIYAEALQVNGQKRLSAIGSASVMNSQYQTKLGESGDIKIKVEGVIKLIRGAQIFSKTEGKGNQGNAGDVTVEARELRVDRQCSKYITGIFSTSDLESEGNTGSINVRVDGLLELIKGGKIYSSTFGEGNSGSLIINANKINIDGQSCSNPTGIFNTSEYEKQGGNAGSININVSDIIKIIRGGEISSRTWGGGNANDVIIHAEEVRIDGKYCQDVTGISSTSESIDKGGNAGLVDVKVKGLLELINGAEISTSTRGTGNAGIISIFAKKLNINAEGSSRMFNGISSNSLSKNKGGNAGLVKIRVKEYLNILNGAQVSSSTWGEGNAGSINIVASDLLIDNAMIAGLAELYSSGHVGNISIIADRVKLQEKGYISIQGGQLLAKTNINQGIDKKIYIKSKQIHLDNNSEISSESYFNAPAAEIHIQSSHLSIENDSRINTSAKYTDGGRLTFQGKTISLKDGQITTSVEGLTSDGGNITIDVPSGMLALDGGFIQANAEEGKGGDIIINADAVIASQGVLEVGGEERKDFETDKGQNIIQAAAPGGEKGDIYVTAPNLDIAAGLVNLPSKFTELVQPVTDPCDLAAAENPNVLIVLGRGGLPAGSQQPTALLFSKDRLEQLLESDTPNKDTK